MSPNNEDGVGSVSFPELCGDRVARWLKHQPAYRRHHHTKEDDGCRIIGEGLVDGSESSGKTGHHEGWRDPNDQNREGASR